MLLGLSPLVVAACSTSSGPPFADLTLSGYTVAEDASLDTQIGTIQGMLTYASYPDYAPVIVSQSNANWFYVDDGPPNPVIVLVGSALDYETNPSPTITVREYNQELSGFDVNNPVGPYHDTVLTITVTDAV